jgi:hypothetical protein
LEKAEKEKVDREIVRKRLYIFEDGGINCFMISLAFNWPMDPLSLLDPGEMQVERENRLRREASSSADSSGRITLMVYELFLPS